MTAMVALWLGHAGGGDEMMLALIPMLVFMLVYRMVRGPLPAPAPEDRPETRSPA
jgi:hypothetical protein